MWSEIAVAGKHVEVYEPPGKARFALLFLHPLGLETLRGRPAYTKLFDELNLACVCPHGQRSWWVDRVCPEFDPKLTPERHLLDNIVPLMQQRWNMRGIGVFGISMGGQGALRLAFRHPDRFPACAGIASALDFHEHYGAGLPLDEMYDSKEHARQDTAILHINPTRYPPHIYFCIDPDDQRGARGNDRLHEKLSALGIPHTIDLTTQAGGHSWQYFDHMAEPTVRFLYDALVKESRRLL
jgi:S-formylglutathione hydrolase FrmB